MRNSILLSTLGLFVAGSIAFADEPMPPPEPTNTTAPTPGVVSPPLTTDTQGKNCGPLGYNRTDRDLRPGHDARVTGGMLLGLGIATLVPGAAMLGWSNNYDPAHDQQVDNIREIKVGGAIATALGAASVVVGIPVLAVGVHRGRKARNERVTFAPSLAPTLGGARASVGGTF